MSAARERVLVAMSGGVDSSVAAALLLEQGHEVIGVTLKMRPDEFTTADSVIQAREAAKRLEIEHLVVDQRREFEQVLRYSWDEYARGRTPNPCVVCNPRVKFAALFGVAKTQGATKIATGHYARIIADENATPRLWRGVDRQKDQSYFLFALDGAQLAATIFPLGELTKPQVRDMARRLGLPNAERAESQDACFVEKGEVFAEMLRRHFGAAERPGAIVDATGNEVGRHEGVHHFTIGQRRGLGVALGRPAWVKAIDADAARIVLTADENELLSRGLVADGVVWHGPIGDEPVHCEIQVRYRHQPVTAVLEHREAGQARVRFTRPIKAVTPGQAAVFYGGDRVLGGGIIERALEE